jgi:hypothetical protein
VQCSAVHCTALHYTLHVAQACGQIGRGDLPMPMPMHVVVAPAG